MFIWPFLIQSRVLTGLLLEYCSACEHRRDVPKSRPAAVCVCRRQATAPSNATARWPWVCRAVASSWQHDESLNQGACLTPPRTSNMRRRGARQKGREMPSHRVLEVMAWKCTMSLSVFCYVPVRWRGEDRVARELMKWLHSGGEGKGGLVLKSQAETILV